MSRFILVLKAFLLEIPAQKSNHQRSHLHTSDAWGLNPPLLYFALASMPSRTNSPPVLLDAIYSTLFGAVLITTRQVCPISGYERPDRWTVACSTSQRLATEEDYPEQSHQAKAFVSFE